MADGVVLNSGSGGSTAATDDCGLAGHAQIVKLAISTDGSATPITADSNGLEVQGAGIAGTPAGGVVSVQGVASGTELPVSAASLPLPSGAATSANQSTANTALSAIQTAVELLDNTVGGTELQVDVVAALPAGTNNIGDVDILSIAAGDNNIGNVDIASIAAGDNNIGNVDLASAIPAGTNLIGAINIRPETANGLTIFRSIDLDETEEEVKATAGQVYAVWFSNLATSTRFLKFYNATALNVTVGTTTPVLTLALPGNTSDDISGVFSTAHGIAFGTAITVAATTGVADNDTGAPGANEVLVNVFYT